MQSANKVIRARVHAHTYLLVAQELRISGAAGKKLHEKAFYSTFCRFTRLEEEKETTGAVSITNRQYGIDCTVEFTLGIR